MFTIDAKQLPYTLDFPHSESLLCSNLWCNAIYLMYTWKWFKDRAETFVFICNIVYIIKLKI